MCSSDLDVGLASCSSEEKALGEARQRKLTVDIGEFCSKKVLGVCVEKKRSYCVFESKLAQIVQQQGRQWQLGVGLVAHRHLIAVGSPWMSWETSSLTTSTSATSTKTCKTAPLSPRTMRYSSASSSRSKTK